MSKNFFFDLFDCIREVWRKHKFLILPQIVIFIAGLIIGLCLDANATYGWYLVIDTNSIIIIISSNNFFEVFISVIGLQLILAVIMFILSVHRLLLPLHYIVVFIRAISGGLLIIVVLQTMSVVGIIYIILFVIVQQILSLAILLSCTFVSLHATIYTCCLRDRLRHLAKYYIIVFAAIIIYAIASVVLLFLITKPLIALI